MGKSSDLILMILDASKGEEQKKKLTKELDMVGIRLNRSAPDVTFVPTKGGSLRFNSTVRLTHVRIIMVIKANFYPKLDLKMVRNILHEYKIHNADILLREDCTVRYFRKNI